MRVMLAHKFHHVTGGAEVFYFEVGRVLEEQGHDVAYFSTEHPDNLGGKKLYTVVNPNYSSGNLIAKVSAFSKVLYSVENKAAMINAIESFKPDLIHVFAVHVQLTPSILEAAKIKGVPVVMSCNDYKHICPNYKLYDGVQLCEACKGGKFYNALFRKCCHKSLSYSVASMVEAYVHDIKDVYQKYVDKFLFASEFMLEKTKEFWVDKDVSYGILRNPFNFEDQELIIGGEYALYFGRIIEEKGVDLLVREASTLDVPMKVVGDGPDLVGLKAYVDQLGVHNIEFLGPLWGDALTDVLNKSAFVVVPSLWHENFPYVIFQAFAAGKPVLGANRGGIPELVGSDRGLIFDVESEGDLGDKMQMLWDDKCLGSRMGAAAHKYVIEKFSDEVFYNALIAHYRSVL